jgi:hypothetical protein
VRCASTDIALKYVGFTAPFWPKITLLNNGVMNKPVCSVIEPDEEFFRIVDFGDWADSEFFRCSRLCPPIAILVTAWAQEFARLSYGRKDAIPTSLAATITGTDGIPTKQRASETTDFQIVCVMVNRVFLSSFGARAQFGINMNQFAVPCDY